MGFMDKAKKLAEQAQQRLDEAQDQITRSQGAGSSSGPAVHYDQHGRPIADSGDAPVPAPVPGATPAPATPDRPHGDPLAPAVPTERPADPAPPPVDAPPAAAGTSAAPGADRNVVDYTPPAVTSGDPLAR